MAPFRATYRLQLGGDMGFAQARELLPYLRDLGVSHLYLSPSFQARAGPRTATTSSTRRASRRSSAARRSSDALAARRTRPAWGSLDVVPNHMATDDANRYWADPGLRAKYFDIDERTGRHRRFFDVDHLAAVRQEDPEVFAETHKLALRLVREGASTACGSMRASISVKRLLLRATRATFFSSATFVTTIHCRRTPRASIT